MSDWQERITHETPPAIQAEHELRYRLAASLILAGGPWADLGCGNGVAAAAALGDARPAHAVLVDLDEQAAAGAARELRLPEATVMAADLTDPEDLQRISHALALGDGSPAVVTCFEVIEHLSGFVGLLEWASALAQERGVTFLISVPNDAFWSIQNPHHRTSWSEGAFEELRGLLPSGHTLLRQVALAGSALVSWEAPAERHELAVATGGPSTVATHFIAAFGPRHDALRTGALAVQADMIEQRRWERQRENDLALMQKVADEHETEVQKLDAKIIEQREQLREHTTTFDQWRAYIHELEGELGRPLSGSAEAIAAEHGETFAANSEERPPEPAEPSS
jgi:SAM-dependent methyltransferase